MARVGRIRARKHAVAEALPFPDAQFDVVPSTLMLHHLPRPVRQQCMREMRRVLSPGGRVLVADFAQAQNKGSLLAHFHRHGHLNPRDIEALLDEVGLRRIESVLSASVAFSTCYRLRRSDP